MPLLDWLNKQNAVRTVQKMPYRLLEAVPELSVGDPNNENLLIQGDYLWQKVGFILILLLNYWMAVCWWLSTKAKSMLRMMIPGKSVRWVTFGRKKVAVNVCF